VQGAGCRFKRWRKRLACDCVASPVFITTAVFQEATFFVCVCQCLSVSVRVSVCPCLNKRPACDCVASLGVEAQWHLAGRYGASMRRHRTAWRVGEEAQCVVRGAGLKGGASGPLAIVWSRPVSKRSGIWPADAAQVCAATEQGVMSHSPIVSHKLVPLVPLSHNHTSHASHTSPSPIQQLVACYFTVFGYFPDQGF